ncbi:MAG: hypothetical protein ALECFALPRED_010940 [Alectoria fallacina]|uniref:Uncharacterized protein n=1 Tax=Alectoria fallacina TaxID=1903189 RepID=A0A8H3F4M5_9LECA|nr:MAG: hypothetical protein ALECFALPRED_010940 [Alectoria fallacina]
MEVTADEILVDVGEEVVVDELSVEVGELVVVSEPPEMVVEQGVEDETPIAVVEGTICTEGAAKDVTLGKELELTGGLAEVTRVVKAAAVGIDDAGLDAGAPEAHSLSTGTLMT